MIFCLSPEFPFRFQEENSIVRQQRQLYSLNRDEKEGVIIFSEKEIAAWKPKGKNEIRTGFSSQVMHKSAREPLVNRLKCKKNDGVSSRFMYSKYDVWRLTLGIFFLTDIGMNQIMNDAKIHAMTFLRSNHSSVVELPSHAEPPHGVNGRVCSEYCGSWKILLFLNYQAYSLQLHS